MAQYIDKSALVAEIERRLEELYELLPDGSKVQNGTITISDACNTGKFTALESFRKYIDTLEVKEADLDSSRWIPFVPSNDLPRDRVTIAYKTNDERGIRYAYGYFQFYNGTCSMFWKDGYERPIAVKNKDIVCWMPIKEVKAQKGEKV